MSRALWKSSGGILGVSLILIVIPMMLLRRNPTPAAWLVFVGGNEVHRLLVLQSDPPEPLHPDFDRPEQLTFTRFGVSYSPRWSPDGTRIVYAAYGQLTDGIAQIFTMSATGHNTRQLTSRSLDSIGAQWLPDGETILYIVGLEGPTRLFTMDSDGQNMHQVTFSDDAGERHTSPHPSPDGEWIAFAVTRQLARDEFYTLPAGGNTITRHSSLHLIRPDGSGERRISESDTEAYDPAWSPDGSQLFFRGHMLKRDLDANQAAYTPLPQQLYVYNVETHTTAPLSFFYDTRCYDYPAVSGEKTACPVRRSSSPGGIDIFDRAGTVLNIPFDLDTLRWSPDGKWLLGITQLSNGFYAMYRVSADGKRIQQIIATPNPISAPDWNNAVDLPWHGWRALLPGLALVALSFTLKRA